MSNLPQTENFNKPVILLGGEDALGVDGVQDDPASSNAMNQPSEPSSPALMNWEGRYQQLAPDNSAIVSLKEYQEKMQQAEEGKGGIATTSGTDTTSLAKSVATTVMAKTIARKWRLGVSGPKEGDQPEDFAKTEIQKKAIRQHKDRSTVELPLPITWAIKEEVKPILQSVLKAYKQQFGAGHQLTREANQRLEDLVSEIGPEHKK